MARRRCIALSFALLLTANWPASAVAQQTKARDPQRNPAPSNGKPGSVPAQPMTPPSVAPPATPVPMAPAREQTIMPRDTLNIVVLEQPAFTGKYLVGLDGMFDYAYIGRVKAAGLTAREVVDELKRRLVPEYLVNPQITIDLEQIANKRVTITGEVRAPAVYPFAGELPLLTAITMAGSVTDRASDQALIFRGGSTNGIPVNLQELLSGQLANNMMLQDGDTVLVAKVDPVYVMGEVQNPGEIAVRHSMTVQQAIALAGGITDKGKNSGIKIQRKAPSAKSPNEIKEIKVNDWKKETVRPGDTIVVPRRLM